VSGYGIRLCLNTETFLALFSIVNIGGLISSATAGKRLPVPSPFRNSSSILLGGLSGLTSDVGQILGTNSIDASGALQTATSLFNSFTSANPSATGLAPAVSGLAGEASNIIAGSSGASGATPTGSAGSGALSSVQSISKLQAVAIVAGATLGGALLL
jgi:hypothetical protein